VTFASFNNLAKMTAEVITLWARVLLAVPYSRLSLLTGQGNVGAERVRSAFGQHGIPAERLVLLPRRPKEQYWRLYHDVDMGLDPFPYNGCVTTCDTLWMGVPVIALAGKTCLSRQGVNLLSNLKLHEWIAETPDAYVAIARRWADDLGQLRSLRAELRERMRASPLVDAARFTRHLEEAYHNMWLRRRGLPAGA
jgi:predicted O-linked N-acetylglucosamine transferase (SPINDLY family)